LGGNKEGIRKPLPAKFVSLVKILGELGILAIPIKSCGTLKWGIIQKILEQRSGKIKEFGLQAPALELCHGYSLNKFT
jgi:hypothetical protein